MQSYAVMLVRFQALHGTSTASGIKKAFSASENQSPAVGFSLKNGRALPFGADRK